MTDLPAAQERASAAPTRERAAEVDVPELLERVEECLGALAEGRIERVHEVQELLRALRRRGEGPAEGSEEPPDGPADAR